MVSLDETLDACKKVWVFTNAGDLGAQCVDDQLIHTGTLGARNGFRLVCEVIREPNGGLFRHDATVSRHHLDQSERAL